MTFPGSPEARDEAPRVIVGMYDDNFDGTIPELEELRDKSTFTDVQTGYTPARSETEISEGSTGEE